MRELGIYIHIPFCKQKCYYCDFISFAGKEALMDKYVQALNKEIILKEEILESKKIINNKGSIQSEVDRQTDQNLLNDNLANKEYLNNYEITTIYIGGGTPSFINENLIKEILNTIYENYNISKNAEITIEVNPGTVNKDKLEMYKKIGINRLSIGLQSTNDDLLKTIGRIHTYQEFLDTYNLARKIGFKNINTDLMLGLPNQTMRDLEESVKTLIYLNPEHISLYSLIVEDGTILQKMLDKKEIKLPSDIQERKMYWKMKKMLEENGYIHYEISNFAKSGFESRHNLNCWNQKEYLGFGVAAHSYLNNIRFCNIDSLEEYIENMEIIESMEKIKKSENKDQKENNKNNKINKNIEILEQQTIEDTKKEYMLLSLRKIEGVNIQEFKNKFIDNPIFLFHNELEKLVNEKLIIIDGNFIKLTKKGLDLANLVWEEFV